MVILEIDYGTRFTTVAEISYCGQKISLMRVQT